MKFRHRLPDNWIAEVSAMEEFANGATQVSVRLKGGREVPGVLVSNSTYIVAVRGHKELPFLLEEIVGIFQSDDDKNPHQKGGWDFWDTWD